MLSDTSRVSEIKQCSRELAARLEWALSLAGVSETVIEMDPVKAELSDHETRITAITKRVTTSEGNISAITKRVTTLEGNTPRTATATPASGWTVNSGTITHDRLSGLMFAALDLTYSTAMANGAVMCTLPAGYRPPSSMTVMGVQSEGGSSGPLTVAISTTGEVRVWPGSTTNKRAGAQLFWKAS